MYGHCVKELARGVTINRIPYKKYLVPLTGLTITIFEHKGPIISGDILIKTLVNNNDGLPHTLEHLIFMGSSSYPKGFLDLAANRCLAGGTNAWTDQDQTVYTVRCAGKDGFLSFLPIFVDHILFPLLTDEAYLTEVHHITGEGDDAGVVYCEMQTYENTMENICERAFAEEFFGENHCYAVETGGLLENLRSSCNIKKCRDFHTNNYRAENVNIIISGNVSISEVITALHPVQNRIIDLCESMQNKEDHVVDSNEPPINLSIPILNGKVVPKCAQFPSVEIDDPGCTLFGYLGPPLADCSGILAQDILIEYLISTPASPLCKALVHIKEPFCSSISYERYMYEQTVVKLTLNETNSARHMEIQTIVSDVLEDVLKCGIDVGRIVCIIDNKLSNMKLKIENHDLEELVSFAYTDHLYGDDLLNKQLVIEDNFNCLLQAGAEFWEDSLRKFVVALKVIILAQPCPNLLKSFDEQEESRISNRIEELGAAKLEELGVKLAEAEELNNNVIDSNLFKNIPGPNLKNFGSWINTPLSKRVVSMSPGLFLYDIDTSFYRFYFIMDLSKLTTQQKLYVPLLSELFSNLPINCEDVSLDENEVSLKTEQLFIAHEITTGLFGEQLCLDFTFKPTDLPECTKFLKMLLFHQVVTAKRAKEYLLNRKANITADERCGYETMQSLIYERNFPGSVASQAGLFQQESFVEDALKNIGGCCKNLQGILSAFVEYGYCLHLLGNSKSLDELNQENLAESFNLKHSCSYETLESYSCFNSKEHVIEERKIIYKVPGEETSYLTSLLPVPSSPLDSTDIKMKVFQYWFGQLDGLVGREVRGKGLAYHFFVKNYPTDGILMFQLQQSSDIAAAYYAVKQIIKRLVSDSDRKKSMIDDHQIDLAKSAVLYSLIANVSSDTKAVFEEMKCIHRNSKLKSIVDVSRILDTISTDDIINLCKEFHIRLFNGDDSIKIVTLPQSKIDSFKF